MLKVMVSGSDTTCFIIAKNFSDDDMVISFTERFGSSAAKAADLFNFSYNDPNWIWVSQFLPTVVADMVDAIAHDMPTAPGEFCHAASIFYKYN